MKTSRIDEINTGLDKNQNGIRALKLDVKLTLTILFVISFIYFYLFGNHVFFYQENLSLFVFSWEYFHQFAVKPGGLLEYAGNFCAQGYFNSVYGSLLVSSTLILTALVFFRICKILYPDGFLTLPFMVLPSCFMLLIQTNINFLFHNEIGFLLVVLYFLFSIVSENKIFRLCLLGFFPLFFYLAGAYALIYLGMIICYNTANRKLGFQLFLLITACVSFLIFKEFLFLQPYDKLLHYPLPQMDYFKYPILYNTLLGLFIIYPILLKSVSYFKIIKVHDMVNPFHLVLVIFSLTIFIQFKLYNLDTVNLFKLERLFCSNDWNGVIRLQEENQSKNMIAQYYYNLALTEKDQLCERMYFGRQDFGTKSILVPWNSQTSINVIFRGVYFFYTVGLINEAHRWAFESMVIQGYRPENIKLLIKTNLINGNYKIASKYIDVLKRTLHYRRLAYKYETMLDHPELVQSDPELGKKIKLQPKEDFLIRLKDPQANVLLLLQSNPGNKKAFEYMLAWFLLEKNVGRVAVEINKMSGMGYTHIPRHIEEAALLFKANTGKLPDLGDLTIRPETENLFSQFESASAKPESFPFRPNADFRKKFGNTYWYYVSVQ